MKRSESQQDILSPSLDSSFRWNGYVSTGRH